MNGGQSYYQGSDLSQQQQSWTYDTLQQSYTDLSSNGGGQAPTFDPTTQAAFASDPTQALYTDATSVQISYTDSNYSNQQLYTDSSYSTQVYTDSSYDTQAYTAPSYDTSGSFYTPVDQSYGGNQNNDMDTILAGSQQIAETEVEGAEDVSDVMG
jgi:hypothetical protein